MSMFKVAPPPASKLGVLRVLSPHAGVRVSPLALGGMSIGDKWNGSFGEMNKEKSFALMDKYFELGGNFIDTANVYQDESSEEFIGEWAETRGIRDQLVIATKYTTNFKGHVSSITQQANYTGNSAKSLHISVEASLKKLRTDYIDLLYVHWWDWDTSVREVMDNLHKLVLQGKVLYLGISDAPAWVVAQANEYALCHGKTPFSIYQGRWNILDRAFEREIIPMARSLGLALAPWGVLAQGKIYSDAEAERRRKTGENGRSIYGSWERSEDEIKVSRALEKVANDIGAKNLTSVAIAYVMQKVPYVFPVIGGRKIENLLSNLEALDITLTDEQITYLESIIPFTPEFPNNIIGDGTTPSWGLAIAVTMQRVAPPQAIRPSNEQKVAPLVV